MARDFIGVGGWDGESGGRIAAEKGLAGVNPARAIGAIVRAMVALCSVSQAGEAGDLRQQSAVAITAICNTSSCKYDHANTSPDREEITHEAYHPVRPALRQRAAGQSGLCQRHSPVAVRGAGRGQKA